MIKTERPKHIVHLILLGLLLPLFAFTTLHKHYVSVTNVKYSKKDAAIQITSRIFIDDFERLLQERYALKANLATDDELSVAQEYIEKYIVEKFEVKLDAQTVSYNFIGKKYDGDIMVCYLEVPKVILSEVSSIQIKNSMLTDIFDEQQNIVHFDIAGKKKSFVLRKSDVSGLLNL